MFLDSIAAYQFYLTRDDVEKTVQVGTRNIRSLEIPGWLGLHIVEIVAICANGSAWYP